MTKLDAKTSAWLKDILCNAEAATQAELVAHFMKHGQLTKEEAEKWVKLRGAFSISFPKRIAAIRRHTACPHCGFFRLDVRLHSYGWMLECAQCGDILSEQEQHQYAMAPVWEVVTNRGYVKC
jgi:hypothetical protein